MNTSDVTIDPWLERWLPLISERAGTTPILELGCGKGRDTATLVDSGHQVIALDLSPDSVAEAQKRIPSGTFYCQDMRDSFPVVDARVGVIVASLSLHYFGWQETLGLVERIRQTLRLDGILLCRLNSTNDHHYGASGHSQIEENYYRVKDKLKRFFDHTMVMELFAEGWNILSVEERLIHRYAHPKTVWEVILETQS